MSPLDVLSVMQDGIADYTHNLEPWMKKVQEYVNSFYGEL